MNSIIQALADNSVDSYTNAVNLYFRTPVNRGKIVLLVEGEDDEKIFEKFINPEAILLVPVFGCDKITGILDIMNDRYQNRLVVIKDADFDRLKGIDYSQYPNLFLTDYHDAEMLMLSGYGIVLLAMKCNVDITKIPTFERMMKDIESLSYLKLYNSVHGLKINFGKPEMGSFYSGREPFNYLAYSNNLFNRSANIGRMITEDVIVDFACSKSYDDESLFQLTNGHDMFDVFYTVIRLHYKHNLKKKDLAMEMRRIYSWSRFKKTELYKSLDKWFTSLNYTNVWYNE